MGWIEHGVIMPRRNQGPRLRWLAKRECFYIVWTERGRSRERSTGTADREQAQIALAEFLRQRDRRSGPRHPNEVLVTDLLTEYSTERGPKVAAAHRIAYAVLPLVDFWAGCSVADITPETCRRFAEKRGRSRTHDFGALPTWFCSTRRCCSRSLGRGRALGTRALDLNRIQLAL